MLTPNQAIQIAGGQSELKKPHMYFVSRMIWNVLELPYQKMDEDKFKKVLEKAQRKLSNG